MAHPLVHVEIRSKDPDATRAFLSGLFGWSYSDGAYPGYVPGVTFGVLADPQGHLVGVAATTSSA